MHINMRVHGIYLFFCLIMVLQLFQTPPFDSRVLLGVLVPGVPGAGAF